MIRSAPGRTERAHRPHDRALAEQRVEERGSVVADLDEEEVRDRRPGRLEPVLAERPLERRAPLGGEAAALGELVGAVDARERRDLGLRADVERAARLADRLDHVGRADAVADPETGEPVDLRERPQHEHASAGAEVLGDAVRVVGAVDVLEVGLVEHRQDVLGDALEVGVELLAGRHRPGRVVRRRDVDELRLRPDGVEQRVEVVVVVDERHLARDGAELERVEHVADEGRPGRHDLVAGIERGDGEMADDRVGAGSRDHVRRARRRGARRSRCGGGRRRRRDSG